MAGRRARSRSPCPRLLARCHNQRMTTSPGNQVRLLLGGDVMTGRGVDQILPHPGDPRLHESYVRDARNYVALAESVNGPIPRPVDFRWPWGDALAAMDAAGPDVRIANLETSVTRSDDVDSGKGVNYRMSPDNVECLSAAAMDVWTVANNHVLDFGVAGLGETLDVLADAGMPTVGAGRDAAQAQQPVRVDAGSTQITVVAFAMPSSGVPARWAATPDRPGVNLVRDSSDTAAFAAVEEQLQQAKRRGDPAVVSVHWGSNWGYGIPAGDVRLAHRLVDSGADVVHGHSSHHSRPIEVYRGKLVLYGCGDLVNDYEGISGREKYRSDLRLLYLATVDATSGTLSTLRILPFQARKMRLHRAPTLDRRWLTRVLDEISRPFGSRIGLTADETLVLEQRR
jgi:poly-gamma-glutamate capsule biosynthesis protein CapA/YwtB (metallophosphatase superfamily)